MATDFNARQSYMMRDLARGQSRYTTLERYYDGDAPLPHSAENAERAYRRFQKKARLNIGALAVAATRERMIISGFRTGADGDENGDVVARRLWKANNCDVLSADIHNMMLIFGEAYAMVGPPIVPGGFPVVTAEDPRQVETKHHELDPRVLTDAIKVWRDEIEGIDFAYFYTPTRVEVFVKPSENSLYAIDGWIYREDLSSDNPLGEIPIVKFENIDEKGEFEPYLDLIDRINHMILQRLVIVTTQAFKQRAIQGNLPQYDQDGNEVDYNGIFEPGPGALWMLPEGTDIWESGQTNIQDIISAVRADIQDFAALTRTPMHYLSPDGANQSAEGAALAREGLVFKAEDRIARVTPSWSKVMSLMFRWIGDEQRANLLDLEPIWKPAERYSMAERADANSKFQDIPFNSRMTLIGQFTPAEIAQMEAERAGETILTQALIGDTAVNAADNAQVRDKSEALGVMIRAGVTPESAAESIGLTGLEFRDVLPTTLKPADMLDAETEAIVQTVGSTDGNA
jgi:hypothetical protein